MTATAQAITPDADTYYDELLTTMRMRLERLTANGELLFVVDLGDRPYDLFLAWLPTDLQQHHTCHACRRFVERYGGLVTIDARGQTASALWPELRAGTPFAAASAAMAKRVASAPVIGVFVSGATVWGEPVTGPWRHFAVTPAAHLVASRQQLRIDTAAAIAAKVAHERECLIAALAEYSADTVAHALAILRSGQIFRAEKCIGIAEWFTRVQATTGRGRGNVLWREAASAPAGFCHVKSTMIGTLLDDLAAGLSAEDAGRKFAAKMNPTKYQRPTAAPTLGNIAAAERLVEQLGIKDSLARRFAKLEECEAVWVPTTEPQPAAGGVFAHLLPAVRKTPVDGGRAAVMTWEKFARLVLPTAETIELDVPRLGAFAAFVTAVDPAAPPILSWDRAERRNPVSMYTYIHVKPAHSWGLSAGWLRINAITRDPAHWYGAKSPNHPDRVFFLLPGARDVSYAGGAGFFVESLRSELHAVRSTLEAHVRTAKITGLREGTAAGLMFGGGGVAVQLRVVGQGVRTVYTIDRMD